MVPMEPTRCKWFTEGVTVTDYEFPLVHYIDAEGNAGTSDITKGEGKLPWRIDWPAKWAGLV